MDDSARQRMELAAHLRPRLVSFAMRRADSRDDAEDAVSTATERVAGAPVDDPRQVEAWLYTTTARACSEQRRRARISRRVAVRLTTATEVEDPAEWACNQAEVSWFATRLGRLPKHLRRTAEVLGQGGTYRDVARELRVTERAARHYVEDAKARLRRMVENTRGGIVALANRAQAATSRRVVAGPVPVWDVLTSLLVIAGIAGALSLVAPADSQGRHHAAARAAPPDALGLASERRQLRTAEVADQADTQRDRHSDSHAGTEGTRGVVLQGLPGEDARRVLRPVPSAVRRPIEDEAAQRQHDRNGGQATPDYDDPPLHEWIIWCVTHAEVEPGSNSLCPSAPGKP